MKVLNRLNLPQPIVDAVMNDSYTKGDADISVTGLLQPPRISVLSQLHDHEIEIDVSDRVWSLFGQSLHTVLERANKTGIAEMRLSAVFDGWKVSGQMDWYQDGRLVDFKFLSVFKVLHGVPADYELQCNFYAALLRANGYQVDKLELAVVLRDWSKTEAQRNPEFPQAGVVLMDVPLWPAEKAEAAILERVKIHKAARLAGLEGRIQDLPECTSEERWARPDEYAVMKPGRKSAVRLYETKSEADRHAETEKSLFVVHRPGKNVRCQGFCQASSFCAQWARIRDAAKN